MTTHRNLPIAECNTLQALALATANISGKMLLCKFNVVSRMATPLWADLKEPKLPKANVTNLKPLHDTLFSVDGIRFTRFYNNLDCNNEHAVQYGVQHLANGIRVLFYEDSTWFSANRNELKRYAAWCSTFYGSNYTLTIEKAADYLTYRVNEKRVQLGGGVQLEGVLPETTLFNRARDIIPVLERFGKWQGYEDLASKLSSKGPVEIIYTQLLRASNTAKGQQDLDFANTSRRTTKRIHPDERSRLLNTIWTGFDNPVQTMRCVVEQLLPATDGRRGEDLREVSHLLHPQLSY